MRIRPPALIKDRLGRIASTIVRRLETAEVVAGAAVVYHRVGAARRQELLVPGISGGAFESHVAYLQAHFAPLPASRLVEAMSERDPGDRFPVAVTLDDDLPHHARTALPILQRARTPATFFLCGGFLHGDRPFWWELVQAGLGRGVNPLEISKLLPPDSRSAEYPLSVHELASRIECLAPEQIVAFEERLEAHVGERTAVRRLEPADVAKLASGSCEIGFHTRRHYRLFDLDDARLDAAMTDGRQELERAADQAIRTIAYPHGKANARVARSARAAGFTTGFVTAGEAVTPMADPLLLPRIPADGLSVGELAWVLAASIWRARRRGR